MKIIPLLVYISLCATASFANDLSQAYEKAYFLETAKGQTAEALQIYRKMASIEATDANRAAILKALERLQLHYRFPETVAFQMGGKRFVDEDFITIEQIRGSSYRFKTGETFLVKGSYRLNSREDANLSFFVTATEKGKGRTGISPQQQIHIQKGEGTFELSLKFPYTGWPHISFYPVNGGNGFGGIYFGTGDWLLKEITGMNQHGSLQEKIETFDMKHHDLETVINLFGEPKRYFFGKESFRKSELPSAYIMEYADGFSILMHGDRVGEFRASGNCSLIFAGLSVGMAQDEAIAIIGKPQKTVTGEKCTYRERILYLNSEGMPNGHAYYAAQGVRLFFMNGKLTSLYITDNTPLTEE